MAIAGLAGGTASAAPDGKATSGVDEWGYNYVARSFSGDYCDAYQGASWCQPYVGVHLSMKWNDAWLSNRDRDGDGSLDRHWGSPTYAGSGAWITNHMRGTYDDGGSTCTWSWFTKIVAVPADATRSGGVWYAADGDVIGPEVWSGFATVQSVYNDPCSGFTGIEYRSPSGPGFGHLG